eukprot:1195466-Prorocentrum_minimum.AAC.4
MTDQSEAGSADAHLNGGFGVVDGLRDEPLGAHLDLGCDRVVLVLLFHVPLRDGHPSEDHVLLVHHTRGFLHGRPGVHHGAGGASHKVQQLNPVNLGGLHGPILEALAGVLGHTLVDDGVLAALLLEHVCKARVYSHDGPIRRRQRGYIRATGQSDAGSAGIFSRRLCVERGEENMSWRGSWLRCIACKFPNTRFWCQWTCSIETSSRRHSSTPPMQVVPTAERNYSRTEWVRKFRMRGSWLKNSIVITHWDEPGYMIPCIVHVLVLWQR